RCVVARAPRSSLFPYTTLFRSGFAASGHRFLSRLRSLPMAQGRDGSHDSPAGPRPPRFDPWVGPWVFLDPEEEREDEEERRKSNQHVERPTRNRLLHAKRGVGHDSVDAEDRQVHIPAA